MPTAQEPENPVLLQWFPKETPGGFSRALQENTSVGSGGWSNAQQQPLGSDAWSNANPRRTRSISPVPNTYSNRSLAQVPPHPERTPSFDVPGTQPESLAVQPETPPTVRPA